MLAETGAVRRGGISKGAGASGAARCASGRMAGIEDTACA